MADINTYALGLEFQLQAQPAIDAIHKMVSASTDLATALAKAGKALDTKHNVEMLEWTKEAQQQLEMHTTATMHAEIAYMRAMEESGIKEAVSAKAALEHAEKIKELKKTLDLAKDAYQEFIDEHDSAFFKDELKLMGKRDKALKQFEGQIKNNTEAIQKQLKPVKDLGSWFGNLTSEAGQLVQVVRKLTGEYGAMGAVLFLIGNGIKNVMSIQDAYAKSTFKLIGTQKQFIDTTLRLKGVLGISTKEALSSVQAIAKVGFSAAKEGTNGINALTEANAKFHLATGVSTATTARFQRELGVLLGSNEAATKQLGEISQAMRASGLSAEQTETLMGDLSKQMQKLAFEMSPKFAADYAQEMVKLSAAFNKTGGSAEAVATQFNEVFKSNLDATKSFMKAGAVFDSTASAADNVSRYLVGVDALVKEYGGSSNITTGVLMRALGVNEDFAESLRRMAVEAGQAGKTITQFGSSITSGANLTRDAAEAQEPFGVKLSMLWHKFEKIWDILAARVIPILGFFVDKIIWVIDKIVQFHDWLAKVSPVAMYLFEAILFGVVALVALKGPIAFVAKLYGILKTALLGIFKPLAMTNQAMAVAKTSSVGAGAGIRSFMVGFAEGLKALGNAQAAKGALVLGLLSVLVVGSLILLAFAMGKLGITGKDMIFAAGAIVIMAAAMWVMSFAITALGSAGLAAAIGAAILIAVMLALGVATMLAGIGIGFMAKGFAELFKAIPNIQTFLVVIVGLTLALPLMAVGIAALGVTIAAMAPLILLGFIALGLAAAIAWTIMPIFTAFGASLMVISTALAMIGSGTGASLISLAIGITAFMGALLGIAVAGAVGGIGKLFGVKSPLAQAQEIAGAMYAIALPASALAGSFDKISKIGDIFKPFIDSTLGRKAEIAEAAVMIMTLATQVAAARKLMGDGVVSPFAPILFRAEPVKKPLITEDTARKIRDERNQSLMVENTRNTNESIKKVVDKLDQDTLKELVIFLKEWLPKIATGDKDTGGLASAANQWM